MTEKESICFDCKHLRGTWINDREVDTWCAIKRNVDCDEMFECDDFME